MYLRGQIKGGVGGGIQETQYIGRAPDGHKVQYVEYLTYFTLYVEDPQGNQLFDEKGAVTRPPTWMGTQAMNLYKRDTEQGNHIVFKAYLDAMTFELSINEEE